MALFVVRHYLGVNFEHGALAIRPALYPGSPPVQADLRFRQGRLRLQVTGSGPVKRGAGQRQEAQRRERMEFCACRRISRAAR